MSKRGRRSRRRSRTRGDEILGAMGGFIAGYMGAEGFLQRYMHPLHWVAAAVVAMLSYGGVWLWYYWRQVAREERAQQDR